MHFSFLPDMLYAPSHLFNKINKILRVMTLYTISFALVSNMNYRTRHRRATFFRLL